MTIETLYMDRGIWHYATEALRDKESADLVLLFGDTDVIKEASHFEELKSRYPLAHIVGASSSGNIFGAEVSRYTLIATVVAFDDASVELGVIDFEEGDDVEKLAESLVRQLPGEGIKHIFLLSDGLLINGSELVRGVNKAAKGVSVTGGMAGDGGRFEQTYIIADDIPRQKRVAALAFYGDSLSVSSGCYAGWSEFGAERTITKSKGNVLLELDGEPALDLYKKYLGEYASELPASGLRFPLSIKEHEGDPEVIRTLLTIDEEAKSITFAGDVPVGFRARLMKPDIDVLIGGAGKAAEEIDAVNKHRALGIVVSCVGRKMVMSDLVDEELEAVEEILGENVQLCGFYSYGEIAPFRDDLAKCELHNQTMTLTAIYET